MKQLQAMQTRVVSLIVTRSLYPGYKAKEFEQRLAAQREQIRRCELSLKARGLFNPSIN